MRVYYKVGKWGAKEKQMVSDIEQAVAKKKAMDPKFDFNPADDIDDLVRLHREMMAEDTEIISETRETTDMSGKKDDEFVLTNEKPIDLTKTSETVAVETDPFNEKEPIIRDYVKEDEYGTTQTGPKRNVFDEPSTFEEAFSIPGAQEDDQIKRRNIGGEGSASTSGPSNGKSKDKPKTDPVNPAFDSMDKPSKNKQTKRFAKRIVGAVSMLLEKGFVWWTTKNINPVKLAEYELNGEVELDLLLAMEDGQQATVRDFFASQCALAERAGKISLDDQAELADALADVLMEKGITPTPTQVLLMSSFEIIGRQAITAFAMSTQTNALLAQLRAMKSNTQEASYETVHEESGGNGHDAGHVNHPVGEKTVSVSELEEEENEMLDNEEQDGAKKVEVEEIQEQGLAVRDEND